MFDKTWALRKEGRLEAWLCNQLLRVSKQAPRAVGKQTLPHGVERSKKM